MKVFKCGLEKIIKLEDFAVDKIQMKKERGKKKAIPVTCAQSL